MMMLMKESQNTTVERIIITQIMLAKRLYIMKPRTLLVLRSRLKNKGLYKKQEKSTHTDARTQSQREEVFGAAATVRVILLQHEVCH